MTNIAKLKAKLDFRLLVQETGLLTKRSKTLCPYHDDHSPSLHVYEDGFFCFVCGASGDHFDWLEQTQGLNFKEALGFLEKFSLSALPASRPVFQSVAKKPRFKTIGSQLWDNHLRHAQTLKNVPEALANHGFTSNDCKRLNIAGAEGDALLPITGPVGQVLALKRRHLKPNPSRYSYTTKGHGAPAWCSPNLSAVDTVLIVEGELNGMMCWLTLRRDSIGVMGTAGAQASFHAEGVKGKTVYIYADDDAAGHRAALRWARQAHEAGATDVFWLEPCSHDACDLAHMFGKQTLRKRLQWGQRHPLPFDADTLLGAVEAAPNDCTPLSVKPDLVQGCNHSGRKAFRDAERFRENQPPALASKIP